MESDFQRVPKENKKTYRKRLRDGVLRDLMDAAFFAWTQPEDQSKQFLTTDNLGLLFRALIGHGCDTISDRHYEIAKVMFAIAASRLAELIPPYAQPTLTPEVSRLVDMFRYIPTDPAARSSTLNPDRNALFDPGSRREPQREREQMEKQRKLVLRNRVLSE